MIDSTAKRILVFMSCSLMREEITKVRVCCVFSNIFAKGKNVKKTQKRTFLLVIVHCDEFLDELLVERILIVVSLANRGSHRTVRQHEICLHFLNFLPKKPVIFKKKVAQLGLLQVVDPENSSEIVY